MPREVGQNCQPGWQGHNFREAVDQRAKYARRQRKVCAQVSIAPGNMDAVGDHISWVLEAQPVLQRDRGG